MAISKQKLWIVLLVIVIVLLFTDRLFRKDTSCMLVGNSVQMSMLSSSATKDSDGAPEDKDQTSDLVEPPQKLDTTGPSRFVYMFETESCLPKHLSVPEAYGDTHSCHCDVIVLSYRKECRFKKLAHVKYIFDHSTTAVSGRNLLLETALKRKETYLYYVFIDDDISLKTDKLKRVNPWRLFETHLRKYEPAVGTVDINDRPNLKDVYNARKLQGCELKGDKPDFLPVVKFDAAADAYHYQAVKHVLPYSTKFDDVSWFFGYWYAAIRAEIMFSGQSVVHTELRATNPLHRDYPRMTPHNTKYWGEILKEVAANIPDKYRNTSLLWEWMSGPVEHKKWSSTVCRPLLRPHMPIKPFGYLEQN